MKSSLILKLVAAAGLAFSSPALAQVKTVDPNDIGEHEPAASQVKAAPAETSAPAPEQQPAPAQEEYQPVAAEPVPAPVQEAAPAAASARASAAVSNTVAKESVLAAAEGVFGRGAEGLAGLLENILKKQGEPTAYITGSEASGAMIVGLRYGKGTLHHKNEGDRKVYWAGPSIGFDAGGDANKVFVLVYNLAKGDDLFTRFPAAEGNAYMVGGLTASYLRKGDTVLIPIRTGIGMRMGVNAGYLKFTEKSSWFPF